MGCSGCLASKSSGGRLEMMHLINQSPFQALAIPAICHEDNHHIVVVVKGTFDIGYNDEDVLVADHQTGINLEDVYWGEPGRSSLKYEADSAISKPGTDVVLIGKALSTTGPVQQLDVSLTVGVMHKVVRVFGNRYWEKSGLGWRMTPTEPFESIPLVYEFAYGGEDPWNEQNSQSDFDQRNPVGRGYAGKNSHRATDRIQLPNLELPDEQITSISDRPEPAGFGFVARYWLPRSLLMGTYDETWETQRNPLLPADFDPASYAAGSRGFCADHFLAGGEEVAINNVSKHGQVKFILPRNRVKVVSCIDQRRIEHETLMDTVVIEPLRNRVILTWRVAVPCHWNLSKIEWIKVLESS